MKHFLVPVALASALAVSSCQDPDLCSTMDDVVFKKYCLENFDTNRDGKLYQEEANAVHNIDVTGLEVVSLKGIENFTNLKFLKAANCDKLRKVVIPNSVTSIEEYAFYGCESMESITIPHSVTHIERNAFYGCTGELRLNCDIPQPDYISDGYTGVFENSDFTSVIIGNNVKSMGCFTFSGSYSLETVTIGKNIKEIGYGAFKQCENLRSVTIHNGITKITDCAFEGCWSLESITIPNGVTYIGNYAFARCSSLESITIPSSVTEIGSHAFMECEGLTSVHISDLSAWCKINFDSEDSTCRPLYYAKNLYLNGKLVTNLTIPSGITEIKTSTFYNCESLTSVTIPDSVTEIGWGAFIGCKNIEKFNGKFASEDGRSLIKDGVLLYVAGSGLTEYTIPNSVTKIGSRALSGCDSSASIRIPETVTEFDWGALGGFPGELIINCNIPSLDKYDSPFCRMDCRSVIIGDNVTSIGKFAFMECKNLQNITIPDSVTEVGALAFYDCDELESVTIGENVTQVGGAAFYDCFDLKQIYCKATTPPEYYYWTVGGYYGRSYKIADSRATIYVPRESVEAYKATAWGDHTIEPYDF